MAEPKNQGEGNREAAKAYNKDASTFAQSGKVEDAAKAAKKALDGEEGKALRQAEQEGRRHSHGEDPQVKR
jgi:hypothetical protein